MANKKAETKKMLKNMEARRQMALDMKFAQYKEEINGTEYIFQYPGKRAIMRLRDESKNERGIVQEGEFSDKLIKTIVVSPSVDLDTFDLAEYMDDYKRVSEIVNVMGQGEDFRKNPKLKKGQIILPKES